MGRLEARLREIRWLKKAVKRLGIRTQGDWLFDRENLEWVTNPQYRQQLPRLYRLFASYCGLWLRMRRGKRVRGAKALLGLLSALQRRRVPQHSAHLAIADLQVFLDLHDPRFIKVVNDLASPGTGALLAPFLSQGDTFLDIGANQGAFSFTAMKLVGPTGRVVSIEPQPQLALNIRKSMELNALCQHQILQIAVGDHGGVVDLIVPRDYSGTAGLYREFSGISRHRRLQVPIMRCDDALDWRHFPGKVFVKLDIEGSEYAFLGGATQMLSTLTPPLLMEINPLTLRAAQVSAQDLVTSLARIGYTHYRWLRGGDSARALQTLDTNTYGDIMFCR
jgi:FkbM family methyltransferase